MPDPETLDERLRAVERALTDGDHDLVTLQDATERQARLDDLDDRLTAVEDRLTELEAAVQAIRGYVGNVRAVNREVERRADAALAAVESLEETDAVEPEVVYPPPERPEEASEMGSDGPDSDESDLLDRVREVL